MAARRVRNMHMAKDIPIPLDIGAQIPLVDLHMIDVIENLEIRRIDYAADFCGHLSMRQEIAHMIGVNV